MKDRQVVTMGKASFTVTYNYESDLYRYTLECRGWSCSTQLTASGHRCKKIKWEMVATMKEALREKMTSLKNEAFDDFMKKELS